MIDIEKLKALAEDCQARPSEYEWYAADGNYAVDPTDLKFIAAANPAAVLELIADGEASRNEREVVCANYDQLKAENEALHHELAKLRKLQGEQVIDFSPCNVQHSSYNNVDCYAIADVVIILGRAGLKVKA